MPGPAHPALAAAKWTCQSLGCLYNLVYPLTAVMQPHRYDEASHIGEVDKCQTTACSDSVFSWRPLLDRVRYAACSKLREAAQRRKPTTSDFSKIHAASFASAFCISGLYGSPYAISGLSSRKYCHARTVCMEMCNPQFETKDDGLHGSE